MTDIDNQVNERDPSAQVASEPPAGSPRSVWTHPDLIAGIVIIVAAGGALDSHHGDARHDLAAARGHARCPGRIGGADDRASAVGRAERAKTRAALPRVCQRRRFRGHRACHCPLHSGRGGARVLHLDGHHASRGGLVFRLSRYQALVAGGCDLHRRLGADLRRIDGPGTARGILHPLKGVALCMEV